MLVSKESQHTCEIIQQQYMWDRNQLALNKYEEVYNQSLVLTCISMKPSILIPLSSESSSLYALQWYGPSD